jgi:predicted DCC family thiol-disulfide oxidoreductase YuxK
VSPVQKPLVVVYDGHCPICVGSARRIQQRFGQNVELVDFRTESNLSKIHPELTLERCQARIHVVDNGRVYDGAEAICRILRRHRLWKYPTYLYSIPPIGWLSEHMYDLVSAHRLQISKWLGKTPECTDACPLHQHRRKPS